jgi:dTDP-4-amino-4,6-dideoxygalactose transaminase
MIPIVRSVMDEREAEAARRVILSGWTTQGPEVAAFEREFAEFVGSPHACAVSNCTTALHLALLAIGIRPGDEVITVSHSFIATANVIRHCGATPVFVDVDPDTYNLDPTLLESAFSPRTRAILCVHQMGMPCDLTAILAFARAHAIPVIEDAACAIGSEILWRGHWERIGRPHGDIACFSFHPRKIVSTGDGGMITTANAALDQKCRLLRQHGMSVPDTVRHGSAKVIFEEYPVVGFNCRMTDIQAAVGREQLKRVPDIVASRRSLADRYRTLLSHTGIRVPSEPEFARSNWQSYCVRLPDHCDQRTVMQRMLDASVASRRGIMCSHREAAYSDMPLRQDLKHSEEAQDRCILLPLYPQMTEAEQDRVVSVLTEACRDHRAVFVRTIGNVAHAEPIPA